MQFAIERPSPALTAISLGVATLLGCCALLIASGSTLPLVVAVAIALMPYLGYYALVRPLLFPFGLYVVLIPFDNLLVAGSGGTVTKILGVVAGLFVLLWVARTHRAIAPDRSFSALAAFFGWACVTALWAVDQQAAVSILPSYAGLILLYGALSITRISARQYRILVYLVIAGGVCAAVYGAAFYHQSWMAAQANDGRLVLQAGENTIDPNHFANAMLLPAAAIITVGLSARRRIFQAIALTCLGLVAGGILLSGSREGLIGLAIVILYQAWRSQYRKQILVAAGITTIVALSVQTSLWMRFASALSTGGSGRTAIWSVGLEAAKHNWLSGYGIGNFPAVYDMYYLSVYQFYPNGWTSPAHNILVHYLIEVGLIGTILLAAFFWLRFTSLRIIRPGDALYDYRVMMESAMLGLLAVSFSIDLFTYKYAWLALSMAALLRNLAAGRYAPAMRFESSDMIAARR